MADPIFEVGHTLVNRLYKNHDYNDNQNSRYTDNSEFTLMKTRGYNRSENLSENANSSNSISSNMKKNHDKNSTRDKSHLQGSIHEESKEDKYRTLFLIKNVLKTEIFHCFSWII